MNDTIEPAARQVEGYIEGFVWSLPRLGVALLVFLVFLALSSAAKWAVTDAARRRHRADLGVLLGGFVRWLIVLFGLLVVATIVFPSVKPADVLATLGFGSVAIGFAFKDILQNWLSGVLILYRQPFRRGDQIRSGDFEGTVENVEARATLIQTYDGQRVVIPNTDIYTRAVIVRTAFPKRRVEYDVGIGYGDDVDAACEVILDALRSVKEVEVHPPPEAFAWALDSSSVKIKVRWWTDSQRTDVVHSQGRALSVIKKSLSNAGIDLPFPTRVVLFHDQTEESDGDRGRQREGWPMGADPPRPRHLNQLEILRSETTTSARSQKASASGAKPRAHRRTGAAERRKKSGFT